MRRLKLMLGVVSALVLLAGAAAAQGDFSPEIEFSLSDTKVKANPEVTIKVAQDNGEEELAHVTLRVPKGFKLPTDEQIPNNTTLGTGTINIYAGPGCNPAFPNRDAKANVQNIPATLRERDRTDEQADRGVWAVWFLDISGVSNVPLEVTGHPTTGFVLDGDIAPNANTCPPFSFELTVNQKAGDVPIFINPKRAGPKVFSATFTSADSPATITLKQTIQITA